MVVADTSSEARRRQLEVYRRMTPQERVAAAVSMSEEAKGITLDGIRVRRPGLGDAAVLAEWMRILHGEAIAARLTGREQDHP